MKITCTKSDLLNGVNIVLKAVPSRTTMTILECILIDACSDNIKLISNDMELGIETMLFGEVSRNGMIAVNAKIFSEIVRKLPDSMVTIETDDNYQTTIRCENVVFTIAGKRGEDFSFLPDIDRTKSLTLSQFSLKEVIRQTIFSISDNDNNKIMTGELFEIDENILKVISLDGHRISIRKIELDTSYEKTKVIVPGKSLMEVSKILSGEAKDEVNIFMTKNHILFEFDSTKVVTRLIEGEYFKIDQMLSGDYETKLKVNKKELYECLERGALLIREGDKKPVIINIRDNTMEININSVAGTMHEEAEISKQGKDIMIGFNPKFLMDALRVIDDEEVSLYMVNPKAPCYIKNEEESYIYLILPVNFIA
ncbi:DNA polymerase III subunit beta [Parasporobacterium paucivorans]|uniref:Beta sliding clamp n=1 Tax=Parasporobacterium paucivorans DSM 15970 TaxID=1122934 RepID=A0A1M6BA76_9FIRM|nr:DNA polymerase III subunit beta [Parasporobacterium paucivorans]SHI45664.1 DNA polymerase III, beta subunit [Parasporobacterium paucivorans DSM 15970]